MKKFALAAVAAFVAPVSAQINFCENFTSTYGSIRLQWRSLSVSDPGVYLNGHVDFVPYGGGVAMLVLCVWTKGNNNPFTPIQMYFNPYCAQQSDMTIIGWWWNHPRVLVQPGDYVTLGQNSHRYVPTPRVDLTTMPTGFTLFPVALPAPRDPMAPGSTFGVMIGNDRIGAFYPAPIYTGYLIVPTSGSWL